MCMPVFEGGKVGREKIGKRKSYESMENIMKEQALTDLLSTSESFTMIIYSC